MSRVPFINKKNMKTARENVGLTTDEVSKKISSRSKDIVLMWESGERLPTWKQLEKAEEIYLISTFFLMSDKLIQKSKSITDYRVGIEKKVNVKRFIRIITQRQYWIRTELKDFFKKNTLLGTGKNIHSPKKLALYIINTLDIDLDDIKKITVKQSKLALKYLIKKAEQKGIFIGKTLASNPIDVKNLRGMFISDEYAPYIILNRRDAISAQIFSLIHELAHFFRKTGGISNTQEFRKDTTIHKEETFCNQTAIELLLPEKYLTQNSYTKNEIKNIADIYKISPIATFYRLKDLKKISSFNVINFEKELKDETKQNILEMELQREKNKLLKKGGGNYINNIKDSNGNLFNMLVSNAYLENKIGHTEASRVLKYSPEKTYE